MQQPIVGPGLCECGCGGQAAVRFVKGHHSRGGPAAFWRNVPTDLPPDACWPWRGGVGPKGYGFFGRFSADRSSGVLAHRLVYEGLVGPTDGLHILHRCDNPLCVNPAHLFAGTNADNVADKVSKGRSACAHRRAFSMAQAEEIRRLWATGEISQMRIARMFGVTGPVINKIVNGRTYQCAPISGEFR